MSLEVADGARERLLALLLQRLRVALRDAAP
jgi:hypothetical protein